MPHIHTAPDQHDMTVSAYILLYEDNEWKFMVHWHRKIEVLMQIGGHIELNETPWQTMAHELEEESGYHLKDVQILQPTVHRPTEHGATVHPVPFTMNTHNVGNDHYHSDLCYGFIAEHRPERSVAAEESNDIRWLTYSELEAAVSNGEALKDVFHIYKFLLDTMDSYVRVSATDYSLDKPKDIGLTYKHGAPGEKSPHA